MPLDMESLTPTHLLLLAGSAFAVALAAAAVWPRRWWLVALVVGLLFPAYTLSSALAGIRRDPTANNLFPVSVAIACALTMVPAFVGAGVGEMIGRGLSHRRSSRDTHVPPH